MNNFGFFAMFFYCVLIIVSILFCGMTAAAIATALKGVGFSWWVYALTIFCSLGGTTGGALININNFKK